jgi:hypothetical protein
VVSLLLFKGKIMLKTIQQIDEERIALHAHLTALVDALEATTWSSWQGTYRFDEPLENAIKLLQKINE